MGYICCICRLGRRRSGVVYRSVATYCTYAARQKTLRSNYVKNPKETAKTQLRRMRAAPPSASTPRRARAVTIAPRRGRTAVTAAVTADCPAPTDNTHTGNTHTRHPCGRHRLAYGSAQGLSNGPLMCRGRGTRRGLGGMHARHGLGMTQTNFFRKANLVHGGMHIEA
jgi:hypothetical protein